MTGDDPPITVTIHSAYKTTEIDGVTAKPGSVFVVTNMTIENHALGKYTFDEKAVIISDGGLIDEKLYTRLTERRYWREVPPGEKRTGEVIFGTTDSMQNLTLRFFYDKGQKSFTRELGVVPMQGDGLPDVNSGQFNVTVHSALKTSEVGKSEPKPGFYFIIVNMTVENSGDTDYPLSEKTLRSTSGDALNQKMYDDLTNPLHWDLIPAHEQRTGEVIFGVEESSIPFTFELLDPDGNILFRQQIRDIPVGVYSSSSSPPKPLTLIVNSADVYWTLPGWKNKAGTSIAVINVTITNNLATDYRLEYENIFIMTEGGNCLEHGGDRAPDDTVHMYLRLPLYLSPGQTKTGSFVYIVFSDRKVNDLILTSGTGKLIEKVDLNTIYQYH